MRVQRVIVKEQPVTRVVNVGPRGPAGFGGGAEAPDVVLKDWAASEAFEATSVTRDSDGVLESAVVAWPDGSTGVLTRTTKNATWLAVDAYHVTHAQSGKRVRQPAVTRSATGSVSTKPSLVVEAIP